jgi:hypothetical protein
MLAPENASAIEGEELEARAQRIEWMSAVEEGGLVHRMSARRWREEMKW